MSADAMHAGFAAALLDPAHAAPRALHGPHAARRFDVHRNNVVASLCDALAAAFPVVAALVGDDCFGALARDYARAHPPRSPQLRLHGARLPAFVANRASLRGLPWLADVARLEWLRMRAFHARDAQAVPPSAFAALAADPARLAGTRVRLHPACRWLRSPHAVHAIWYAHQAGDATRRLSRVDPGRAEDVLVLRPAFDVSVQRLPAGGVALLRALRRGAALGPALLDAMQAGDGTPDALLRLATTPGVLAGLHSTTRNR